MWTTLNPAQDAELDRLMGLFADAMDDVAADFPESASDFGVICDVAESVAYDSTDEVVRTEFLRRARS